MPNLMPKLKLLKTLEVITKSKEIPINKIKSQMKIWVKIYIELIQLTPAPELMSHYSKAYPIQSDRGRGYIYVAPNIV